MGKQQYSAAQQSAAVQKYKRIEEIVPPHWSEGDVFAHGIRQHYYRTGGNKPPLVLLHGILAGGLYWTRVAKTLEQDYDVIMVDTRGHGRSERIGTGFSYELLTEDAASFIRVLKLDKPSLLGHSMGGAIAVLVAASYPDLVRSILLEESAWGEDATSKMQEAVNSEGYKAWMKSYLAYLERLKTQTHEERLVSALTQLPPGTAVWPEEEFVPWVEVQAQLDLELVKLGPQLWSMMKLKTPLSEFAHRITCPILLMTGNRARGGLSDPQVVQNVVAAWHDGQHVYFEEAGHLIHLDQFDRFITVVRAFLKQH